LGQAELHARKAERYEVFEANAALTAAAREPFDTYNGRGVEGLTHAKGQLQKLKRGLEAYDEQIRGRDLVGELNEHRSMLFAELAEIEMKQSDAQKLRALVDEAIDATKN